MMYYSFQLNRFIFKYVDSKSIIHFLQASPHKRFLLLQNEPYIYFWQIYYLYNHLFRSLTDGNAQVCNENKACNKLFSL